MHYTKTENLEISSATDPKIANNQYGVHNQQLSQNIMIEYIKCIYFCCSKFLSIIH